MKILIVDDNRDNLYMLEALLGDPAIRLSPRPTVLRHWRR